MPLDTTEEIFSTCISNLRDNAKKQKFLACKNHIVLAANDFNEKVHIHQVHTIEQTEDIAGIVTKSEMTDLYDNKMAKKSSPGRKYYDKIISSPRNGICPLCGQRVASTLDHYLPKKKYPSLAITPTNLIPACKDCNTGKGETYFKSGEDETLHPYFDDVENNPWLYAQIIEEEEITIIFEVRQPQPWSKFLYARVVNHFNLFKLNSLYSTHAVEELMGNRRLFVTIYNRTGPTGISEHLKECYMSHRNIYLNSWKTAMYRALYESQWFCEEWLSRQP